ncbi:MAG: hypothetical protein ISS15_18295 [Alphaproteobacteria bacterium]|nr:hypothetical protein [Alphaproteobacteria bacterium]MBL6939022.1 hypothetical protein [Alphaproteobacteria bacterium]MBL7099614.1 hypothetical protein [Alphaproteobacteria bacterium]
MRVTYTESDWQFADFAYRLLRFGPHRTAALAAVILGYYHFDEQCVITRPNILMTYRNCKAQYWLSQ